MSGNGRDLDAVVAKVQKLFALGTSSNEHEAALAVAKAQELMEAHGLRMEQVQGRQHSSAVTEGSAFDVYERGKPGDWKEQVLYSVAETSGVKLVWTGRSEWVESKHAVAGQRLAHVRQAYLVGLPLDVEVAGYTYAFLAAELERLAKAYTDVMWAEIRQWAKDAGLSVHRAEQQYTWRYGTHPLKAKVSWLRGAADGVDTMLRDEARRRRAESPAVDALVVNREAAIRDYWYMKMYGMTYEEWIARANAYAEANPSAVGPAKTASQIRREREREERRRNRSYDRWQRAEERKWRNTDMGAYDAGVAAGRKMTVRPGVGRAAPAGPSIRGGE